MKRKEMEMARNFLKSYSLYMENDSRPLLPLMISSSRNSQYEGKCPWWVRWSGNDSNIGWMYKLDPWERVTYLHSREEESFLKSEAALFEIKYELGNEKIDLEI